MLTSQTLPKLFKVGQNQNLLIISSLIYIGYGPLLNADGLR
jgi:hypothetical protein